MCDCGLYHGENLSGDGQPGVTLSHSSIACVVIDKRRAIHRAIDWIERCCRRVRRRFPYKNDAPARQLSGVWRM